VSNKDSKLKEFFENNKDMARHIVDYSSLALTQMNWFPGKLAYQMNVSKDSIRKNPGLKKFQRFITACSDAGILTRQEIVSMLPPLFLDLQPTDLVLDLCAAPGSKTSQMLETILSRSDPKIPQVRLTGGVVANDADAQRACMLTHQLQRIDTAGMLVLNHEGQHLPTIRREETQQGTDWQDNKVYFDKVLADVPCSGDGAIRKIPMKWRGWSSKDGNCLHPLQIQLLERSIMLCKTGGLVLYSTCSLNPIENEAVVSEVLHRANFFAADSLELVDIHTLFPGLIGRRGLHKWSVMVEKPEHKSKKSEPSDKFTAQQLFTFFDEYKEGDEIQAKNLVKQSMFPKGEETTRDKQHIEYTMRIMPEDMNTGGFYLALLRKKKRVIFGKRDLAGVQPQEQMMEEADEPIRPKQERRVKNTEANKELPIPSKESEPQIQPSQPESEAKQGDAKLAPEKEVAKESKPGYRRGICMEYHPFLPSHQACWDSIRDMYGFDDVSDKLY
jgi:multisite-specific tRNA:(cytosine-C5)-methyltransferase